MLGFRKETPPSIIERETFAEEKWFKAFYEGNSLIPFTGEGIELCLAIETIHKEENIDWHKFSDSVLSPKQLKFLADAMNAQHKHKGILVSTPEQAGEFKEKFASKPRIVDDERLQGLWEAYKYHFFRMIVQYIFQNEFEFFAKNKGEQAAQIEQFFKNSKKNGARISDLKKALGVISKSLYSPAVQALLREYREEFRKPDFFIQDSVRMKWLQDKQPTLKAMIMADLDGAFEGSVPEDIKFFVQVIGWTPPFD
jgi:hypothetical protein